MCSPLGKMLCEVVFLCNKLLNPENTITFSGENARPKVRMKKYEGGDLLEQTEELNGAYSRFFRPSRPRVTRSTCLVTKRNGRIVS